MAGRMTSGGIKRAAAVIGCSVPALRAVIAVEAAGEGFLEDGRPKILFERHKFFKFADPDKRAGWSVAYPDICNPLSGGYLGNEAEWPRLYRALQLDPEAAVLATSWGLGQLMGFNYKACGESSLFGFLFAMHHNEDAQLMLMAQFIRASGAADELARLDWDGFRILYNGPASPPEYGTRLRAAYARALRDEPAH